MLLAMQKGDDVGHQRPYMKNSLKRYFQSAFERTRPETDQHEQGESSIKQDKQRERERERVGVDGGDSVAVAGVE